MYYIKYILFILIIIIIISSVMYYLYIKNNNIEKFSSDIQHLTGGKIDSRPCAIYFTDDIKGCDSMSDLYKKGLTQLDILIYQYSKSQNSNDKEFLKNLLKVKQDKISNINNCKIELKNWKEINNYYNVDGNPDTRNIIPKKSTKMNDTTNVVDNILLSGTCLKEYNNGDKINTINDDNFIINNNIVRNIIDENDPNGLIFREYIGVDIKLTPSLSYSTLNNNICTNDLLAPPVIEQPIDSLLIFTKLKCAMEDNIFKIKNINFVIFNHNTNNFEELKNKTLIQDKINTLFRYYYDTVFKNIMYGPKNFENISNYILQHNSCGKIDSFEIKAGTFSLSDLNFNGIIINTYKDILNDSDIKVDDNTLDYKDSISKALINIVKNIDNELKKIDDSIDNINLTLKTIKDSTDIINNKISDYTSKNQSYITTVASLNCDSMPDKVIDTVKRQAALDAEAAVAKAASDAAKANADSDAAAKAKAASDASKIKNDILNLPFSELNKTIVNTIDYQTDESINISQNLKNLSIVYDYCNNKISNPSTPKLDSSNYLIVVFALTDALAYSVLYKRGDYFRDIIEILKRYIMIIISSIELNNKNGIIKLENINIIIPPVLDNFNNFKELQKTIIDINKILCKFYLELYNPPDPIYNTDDKNVLVNIKNKIGIMTSDEKIAYYKNISNKIDKYIFDLNQYPNKIFYYINTDDVINTLFKAASMMGLFIVNKNNFSTFIFDDSRQSLNYVQLIQSQMMYKTIGIYCLDTIFISRNIDLQLTCLNTLNHYFKIYGNYFTKKESFTNQYNNIEKFVINNEDYYIEKFFVNDQDFYIINDNKTACFSKLTTLQQQNKENNNAMTKSTDELKSLKQSKVIADNQLKDLKNKKASNQKLRSYITEIINGLNKKITLEELNNMIRNKAFLNYTNYINNVSTDDCIYFI